MKNSSDTIANRTSDLPACSAVPQPAAPLYLILPLTSHIKNTLLNVDIIGQEIYGEQDHLVIYKDCSGTDNSCISRRRRGGGRCSNCSDALMITPF